VFTYSKTRRGVRKRTITKQSIYKRKLYNVGIQFKYIMVNKKGNWTLSAIFGVVGAGLVVLPFLTDLSKLFILLGIIFIVLAFMANK